MTSTNLADTAEKIRNVNDNMAQKLAAAITSVPLPTGTPHAMDNGAP